MENNFSISFGNQPNSYIQRGELTTRICNNISLDFPLSHIYIITGVRRSGKTVLLKNVSSKMKELKNLLKVLIKKFNNIIAIVGG